ncbi:CaiB/BaiF CoA-transferase family protein [soil metagenome]
MFKDLKVLELASVLAGPSVGQFFAELGAEVIKIENLRTGGDITRSWKGAGEKSEDLSAYFCSCNWGKKSVAIDLDTNSGKKIIQKLIAQSDIVIASYKPGDAEKLGVSYEQLIHFNTQLIYGQITGYGSSNDRVGYDAVIQAESGFMELNGEKNGPPIKMPVALIDVLAGHQLKEGLLLALLKKERTGVGSFVEVSLIQTAMASLVNQATNWLVAKKLPTRQGSSHPNIAPYGDVFETRDGKRILLAVGTNRQFKDLLSILQLDAMSLLPEYATNESRVVNRSALNDVLSTAIAKIESAEFLSMLHLSKVPAGLLQNVKELFEMPEAKEMLIEYGSLIGVKGLAVSGLSNESLTPPPMFGQHTDEILLRVHL